MKFIIKSSKDIAKLKAYLKLIKETDEIIKFNEQLNELIKTLPEIKKADKTTQIEHYRKYNDIFLKDAGADIKFTLQLFTQTKPKIKKPSSATVSKGRAERSADSGSKTSKKRVTKPKYIVILSRSDKKDKRFMVNINNEKTIHFGSMGKNYTMHGDKDTKKNYIKRHKENEVWTLAGIKTAGFWSKHILWNKKTISESIKAFRNKYKSVKIILSRE